MTTGFDRRTFFFKVMSLALGAAPSSKAKAAGQPFTADEDGFDEQTSEAPLQWLDGQTPQRFTGVTWGTPWPQGKVPRQTGFELRSSHGSVAVQSWPLAYWPDGSIKWSAHALAPADLTASRSASGEVAPEERYTLAPALDDASAVGTAGIAPLVTQTADTIHVDTGTLQCSVPSGGDVIFRSLSRSGHATLRNARLVVLSDERRGTNASRGSFDDELQVPARTRYQSVIDAVVIEQTGRARAVLKLSGTHRTKDGEDTDAGGALLPFVVRLYFYRGSDSVRVVHSLIYDADASRTSIRGIGLRFAVPLADELHNRYVRFVGANGGVFAEAVRGLSGLRRSPGLAVEQAQRAGRAVPPVSEWPPVFAKDLRFVPAFGDYTPCSPPRTASRSRSALRRAAAGFNRRAARARPAQATSARRTAASHLAFATSGRASPARSILSMPIRISPP